MYTRVEGLDTVWRAGTRQPDGKIIAVGATVDPQSPGHYDLAMARYLDNGTLDPAFNDRKGWVRTHLSSLTDGALAVTLQSTGNIIVGGLSRNHGVVVRYIG
ncbi:delta-60 repeat domain-containing protein [Pseudomonas fluorescens]|uniref:delta-60 repeat domain-containing protein n=1 Tax=Pseudomonas fluorescens TaxID=294 RepID=UPI00177B12D8